MQQEETDETLRNKLKGKQLFACRYCQGDHLTQKCPFKDVAEALLAALGPDAPQPGGGGGTRSATGAAPGQTGGSGTYVPRAVAAASGGGMESRGGGGGMSYAGAAKSSSGAVPGAYKPPSLLSSDSAGYRGDGRSRTGAYID